MNFSEQQKQICKNTLRILDAFVDEVQLVEKNPGLGEHLKGCKSCSEALQARLRVKSRLQHAVKGEAAPASLRDRIRKAIFDENKSGRGSTSWVRWWMPVAAILVLCLGGWAMLQLWNVHRISDETAHRAQEPALSKQTAEILGIGIGDHVHCVIDSHFDKLVMTTEQMAQEMGPEYSELIPLLKKSLPEGSVVSGGHRCSVKGREFIHVVLKHDDKAISVVITEKRGLSFPVGSPSKGVEGRSVALYEGHMQSLEAVGFETKDHLAFVVSSLDPKENYQFAFNLAPVVTDFLNKL